MAEPIPLLRAEGATYSSSSRATSPSYQTFGLRLTSPIATAGLPARIADIDLPASSRLRRAPNISAPGDGLPNSVLKSWSSRPTSAASFALARRGVRSWVIDAILLLGALPNVEVPSPRRKGWALGVLRPRFDALEGATPSSITHRPPDSNVGELPTQQRRFCTRATEPPGCSRPAFSDPRLAQSRANAASKRSRQPVAHDTSLGNRLHSEPLRQRRNRWR
jgi:hypothetical protein